MVEQYSDRSDRKGLRRLLQEAAKLSNALDIIIATQGGDSPAVTPLVRQLSSLHRFMEEVYEEKAETNSPLMRAPEQEVSPDIEHLSNRLAQTEGQFNELKDSITQLVGLLGAKKSQ